MENKNKFIPISPKENKSYNMFYIYDKNIANIITNQGRCILDKIIKEIEDIDEEGKLRKYESLYYRPNALKDECLVLRKYKE